MPPTEPPPRRLLLVDDNPEGRSALEKLLAFHGFRVEAVSDGASALAVLSRVAPPDIVLVDLILPDMDGVEVCRRAGQLTPRPFVARVTGWSFEADVRDLTGIDEVFYKPIDVASLVGRIDARRPPTTGH